MANTLTPIAIALAALTAARLAIAAILPLTPDEAYYWVWSKALAPGYVDHPPMVALWIHLGTVLLGDSPLGVRLLGPLATAAETLLLADAADRLFPDRRAGLCAGVLWNGILFVGAGASIMTPDAPLLFFWCAAVWAAIRIATGGRSAWWLVAGASAGAAIASKYTALFLWVGIGLWTLAVPSIRRQLRGPMPWLGAGIGQALFLPVVLWNAGHGWVSFLRQGGRVADWRPERAMGFMAELVGGQFGLVTPGIAILCVAGLVAAIRRRDVLLPALVLPPALVFVQHALGDRVQGNWPAILYPASVIAAAGLAKGRWTGWFWPSACLGFGLTAVGVLHATTAILPLPPRSDPAARQLAGWEDLTAGAVAVLQRENSAYVVAEEYALISELAWNAPLTVAVVGIDARLRPTDLRLFDMAGKSGILIRAEHRGDEIDGLTWSSAVPLGFIERVGKRGMIERYRVWRVIGRTQGVALPSRGSPVAG